MFGWLFIYFPTALNHFSCCAIRVNRLTTQILWRAFAKGAVSFIFRLQPAASRHPDGGHKRLVCTLVTPNEAALFFVRPGCLKDITPQRIKAQPRAQSDHDPLLSGSRSCPPQPLSHELWVAISQYNRRCQLSSFITALVGSLGVLQTWPKGHKGQSVSLRETHTLWSCMTYAYVCTTYRATEEIKALDDYYYIGFPSEWLLTQWKLLRL